MPPVSWRSHILFLFFSIYWILLPSSCFKYNGLGSLTVEPPIPFLMGSDLTLYCHVKKCTHLQNIFLENGNERMFPRNFINCSAVFHLTNVQKSSFSVFCKIKDTGSLTFVTGITLRSGLPPDKPLNISCETTRNAHFVTCTWKNGKKTHMPTTYNISVNIENGSLVYSQEMQDKENCLIPQKIFYDNFTYQVTVFAHNHFGKSQSDPLTFFFNDIVIPEIPRITEINFKNESLVAILRWKTNESSENLKPYIRVYTANERWEERGFLEIGDGLVQVNGLRPLTDYKFQVKTCTKQFQHTEKNCHTVRKTVCSKWSPSFWKKTPGKGPSQPLHVWSDSVNTIQNEQHVVKVFWKPPPAHDYSGEVYRYEVFLSDGQKQEHSCAPLSQCSATVPLLQPISVTAVTPYGTSPPATVPLTQSDAPGPVLREVAHSVNGSALVVYWTRPEQKEELLNYVTEWRTLPPTELHWKSVSKDHKSTTIKGLMPGVRYNISVYAVTTRGVCAPSSSVVYSKQLKPQSGPVMSVLAHESNKVLVKWDELPMEERKGFIISYTIYYRVSDSSSSKLTSVPVPAQGPRQHWLDCPEGTLVLHMTASTAAGEGPEGYHISSHPPASPVGLVVVIVFIITIFIAIIVNLMCWKCVRKRIKQKCIAWGPEWLGDNLPKLKNSNAIKLLELNRSEPSLFSSFSDPPLSPISFLLSYEREELYPSILVETEPLQTTSPLLVPEDSDAIYNSRFNFDHISYKPQTAFPFPEPEGLKITEEQNMSSDQFEGFIEGLLSNVRVDLNNSKAGLNLDIVHFPSLSKTDGINFASMEKLTDKMDPKPDLLLKGRGEDSSDKALVDFLNNTDGSLACGYFPQITM